MAKPNKSNRRRVVGVGKVDTGSGQAYKQQQVDQQALNKLQTESYKNSQLQLQAGQERIAQLEQERDIKRQQLEDEKLASVHYTQRRRTQEEILKFDQEIKKVGEDNKRITKETADHTQKVQQAQDKLNDSKQEYLNKLQEEETVMAQIGQNIHDQKNTLTNMYGEQKDYAAQLQIAASMEKEIAAQKRRNLDLSIEDRALLEQTISDRSTINTSLVAAARESAKITLYEREKIPHMDKIREIQAEMAYLQEQQVQGLTKEQELRLAALGDMEKQYQTLSKLEQRNERIKDINKEIQDIVFGQNTAFGQVMSTIKDIVTNPLTLFTGLLALGIKRYETMRQYANQLAEEQDRVNKKLAGAGVYQTEIIKHAKTIESTFSRAGEGFAQSFESAVDATVALSAEFGRVDFVSGELVEKVGQLKLGLGLTDEESAKVLNNFDSVSGLTEGAAANAADLTYQLAEQHGLDPAAPFKDIAAASGETLGYFSGGAVELGKAAVQARRMGLTLDDMANVAKTLLDFETSIEKEMEAQLITGRNLDFGRARQLAMMGKTGEAVEDVLKQVGGVDKFNAMMPHQQKALADAVGLSVGQLRKSNDERAREAKLAEDRDKLVGKSLESAVTTTRVLGKLETGLGVIEKISNIIGDIFLEVFMPPLKGAEDKFVKFFSSDFFKNGLKNVLFMIKGIIQGIGDAISDVMGFVDKLTGGRIGGLLKSITGTDSSKFFQTSEDTGRKWGKAGTMVAGAMYLGSKVLGMTRMTPMWVKQADGGLLGNLTGGKGGNILTKLTRGLSFLKGTGMRSGSQTTGLARIANAFRGGGMTGGTKAISRMANASHIGRFGTMLAGGSKGATAMGGTLLGGTGVVLGGAMAAGAIGKGIYDVSQLDNLSTGREAATAKGGLGGAAGGAAIGAAVGSAFPVVGTLLGAGIGAAIGYFGGRAVGSMDAFADKLDKSRDKMAESIEDVKKQHAAFQTKVELNAKIAHAKVYADFEKMSGGAEKLMGKQLDEFGKKMIDSGNITKEAFEQLAKDGLTLAEVQQIAAGAQNAVTTAASEYEQQVLDATAAEQAKLDAIRAKEDIAKKMADSDYEFGMTADALSGAGLLDMSKFGGYTEKGVRSGLGQWWHGEKHYTEGMDLDTKGAMVKGSAEYKRLAEQDVSGNFEKQAEANFQEALKYSQTMIGMETGEKISKEDMEKLMNTVMTKNAYDFSGTAKETEKQLQQLTRDIQAQRAIELETQANDMQTKILQSQAKAFAKYASADGDSLSVEVTNQPKETGEKAKGGLLQGPSHADGGIQTRFGELEGGEAVINKRSTAMFTGLLSKINQAGGGVPIGQRPTGSGEYGLGGKLFFTGLGKFGGAGGKNIYSGYKVSQGVPASKGLMKDGSYQIPPQGALEAVFENRKLRNTVSVMQAGKGTQHLVNVGLRRFGMGALKFMPKILGRAVPGLGWALLAYDVAKFIGKAIDAAGVQADKERKAKLLSEAQEAAKREEVANKIYENSGGFAGERIVGPGDMFASGGVAGVPQSPIKRVGDMIMTKDGQMIQTDPEDNIIAKKGGITQKTAGGGKSRVEELLEQLIIVTQEVANRPIEMDGTKVSTAINEANFRA